MELGEAFLGMLALAMGLLAACSHERADPRGQPEIYRGPLTVVAKDHSGGTIIQRSAEARSRTTWLRPDGRSHDLISDGVMIRRHLERFPDGASSIEWEAISVSRAPLPSNTFVPPSGGATGGS